MQKLGTNIKVKNMKTGEFLSILTEYAKNYREISIQSIKTNKHMNDVGDTDIPQNVIDAVIVDFVNYIGGAKLCRLWFMHSRFAKF